MSRRNQQIFIALSLFLIGVTVGHIVFDWRENVCEKSYEFINAEVICDHSPAIQKTGYAETQGKIEAFISRELQSGRATEVAVYFRDLENGPVWGINETAEFAPASLLKLPLALVYLIQVERNPAIFDRELSVAKPQWSFVKNFFPSTEEIDPTKPHTIEELLMHMLKHSDNNAYGVLQTYLYEAGLQELIPDTFLELGFIDPEDIADEVISVRRYASIFRALYNVSFLNAELSEKVLDWLVMSDFDQGLVDSMPKDIMIAHKFGERLTEDGTKQLHDCGIIYYPKNPYLLCVMTKGQDFGALAAIIRSISAEVYKEVDSRRL